MIYKSNDYKSNDYKSNDYKSNDYKSNDLFVFAGNSGHDESRRPKRSNA